MANKKLLTAFLALVLLTGCSGVPASSESPESAVTTQPSQQEAFPVINPNFQPDNVRYKNTYTGQPDANAVVATAGDAQLTLGQLQCWYWAEAARYCRENPQDCPDLSAPLEDQPCPVGEAGLTWQQFFLTRALNAWHTAQAMHQMSLDTPLEFEEAYQPDLEKHQQYMEDIPAAKFLYGNSERYQINTLHQTYLDSLPDMLEALAVQKGFSGTDEMAREAFGASEKDLTDYARIQNLGYMYMTFRSYDFAPTAEEVERCYDENRDALAGISKDSGDYVRLRVMLLLPEGQDVTVDASGVVHCTEEQWDACGTKARDYLAGLDKQFNREPETVFAELAEQYSQDKATALDGGRLDRIVKGQLIPELNQWCFAPERQPGDSAAIRTEYGYYAVFLAEKTPIWYAEAEDLCRIQMGAKLLEEARQSCPMEMDFSRVELAPASGAVGVGEILYPDIAHERFPEVPLYLQQDYPKTLFGSDPIRTIGCGITSMSMLASYMTDEELTPPVMCQRYGRYGSSQGTDGMIFIREPPAMGFYLHSRCFDPAQALEGLKQGYIVVSNQTKGYWTRTGHYIVIEKLNEDGTVQVRDSNLYNYNNSWRPAEEGHLADRHAWSSVTAGSLGYWIFEHKITRIPACARCGDADGADTHVLAGEYLCRKCHPALLRQKMWEQ